jgi:hypothetical protein
MCLVLLRFWWCSGSIWRKQTLNLRFWWCSGSIWRKQTLNLRFWWCSGSIWRKQTLNLRFWWCSGSIWHVISQHSQNDSKILCPLCQEDFKEKRGLEKHLMNTHSVKPCMTWTLIKYVLLFQRRPCLLLKFSFYDSQNKLYTSQHLNTDVVSDVKC